MPAYFSDIVSLLDFSFARPCYFSIGSCCNLSFRKKFNFKMAKKFFLRWVRRFEANVAKCAVVVFRNEKELDGTWTWDDSVLPHLNYYTYLGVKFTCNGHWEYT